jgi:hypothetical protein
MPGTMLSKSNLTKISTQRATFGNKAFYFMPYGSGASVYHFGYETFESLISASSYTATALFQITTSAYGLFAIACDGNSVVACGWNSSGLPTYMVAAIVLLIVLPCAGCIGFIVGACKRREMKFPEDQWANMPLNQEPEKNGNEARPWRAEESSFPPIKFTSN